MKPKSKGKKPSSRRGTKKKAKKKSPSKPVIEPGKKPEALPTAHPFISPYNLSLANEYNTNTLSPENREEFRSDFIRFLESLDLSILAEILKSKAHLYFHPVVWTQVLQLINLQWDEREWDRLGWGIDADENGIRIPPKEVEDVNRFLQMLLEAHAKALFPWQRIEWKPLRQTSGPKGILENPHPTPQPWTKNISADQLFHDFRELKEKIKSKYDFSSLKRNPSSEDKFTISQIGMEALHESGIDWSGRREIISEEPPFDPEPPDPPDSENHGTFRIPYWRYGWKSLDLHPYIEKMCSGNMGNAGKDGKPSYLAYAILGKLFDKSPTKIRDVIENYRRKQPPRKPRLK